MNVSPLPHIVVCVCTYRRVPMLDTLLGDLAGQDARGAFTWSVRIVDNDRAESARAVVEKHSASAQMNIEYLVEAVQNISHARNRAVTGTKGEYIAMIDDDERPPVDWLWQLWNMMARTNADGVLGPVVPAYPDAAPAWLRKSGICERPSSPSGKWLAYHETRTGNALLRAPLFRGNGLPFNPDFGRGGGEDIDFFRRRMRCGDRFIWCSEGGVQETVSADRWQLSYYCRRQLRLGGLLGHRQRQAGEVRLPNIARAFARLCFHSVRLVLGLPFGKHIYCKGMIAVCYQFGYLTAAAGFVFLKDRDELECQQGTIASRA